MNEKLIELSIKKLLEDDYLSEDDYCGKKIFAKKEDCDIEGYNYSVYFQYEDDSLSLYFECDLKQKHVDDWKR